MDPLRQPNQDHHHHHHHHQDAHSLAGGYPFNNIQNDTFDTFFTNDPTTAYNPAWDTDMADPNVQNDDFVQGNHTWTQNPLQTQNQLHTSNYVYPSRAFNNSFPQNSAPFGYPGFDPHQASAFSTPPYDPALTYGNDSLSNPLAFGVQRPQDFERSSAQGQTISPQALQSYPNIYSQFPPQEESETFQPNPNAPRQLPGSSGNRLTSRPLDRPQQKGFSTFDVPAGSARANFLVIDPAQLTNITNSSPYTGNVFLGQNSIEIDAPKVVLPRLGQRRSKNEVRQALLNRQGIVDGSTAREPLLKKLKLSRSKSSHSGVLGSTVSPQDEESESTSDSSSGSESEGDSEYDSGSEEETVLDDPSPLPSKRPSNPGEAIAYDTVKAVWAKRTANLTGPIIRTALGDYWAVVKGIRDKWKVEQGSIQQAEEKKDQAKISEYKKRAAAQRNIMESVIRLTLKHGHRDIIQRLGEIHPLLIAFYQLIADRFKESDYGGTLIKNILQLIAQCATIDQAALEKVKIDKILPKLLKKGDDRVKTLSQKILDNAAALSSQKTVGGKPVPTQDLKDGPSKLSVLNGRLPDSGLGAKAKVSLTSTVQPSKKTASAPLALGKGAVTSAKVGPSALSNKRQSAAKSDLKPSSARATGPNAPSSHIKVNHVVAKPSTFFSSLQSASKKPGTSNAAQKTQQSQNDKISDAPESRTPGSSAPPAPAKPAFSFAETMANLTKPKPAESSRKSEESRTPETEEERAKRLRKEERRKLRVSFAPDESLVQIRTFVHDPEEELGHDSSMVRDVGDIGSEGRMLKMHKDLDIADDDEDREAAEEELAEWKMPTMVDFSVIEDGELARNYATRGGNVEVKSHERAVQEQRELTTLMVIYTAFSDIPASPREPSDPYTGEHVEEQSFGLPSDETKAREAQYLASQNPPMLRQVNPPSTGTAPTTDISNLLRILNGAQQPQSQLQPIQQQPVTQQPSSGLEAIFAQFSGGNPPATQAQMSQSLQQTSSSGIDIQALLTRMASQNQVQPTYQPPQPAQTQDLGALLAQFSQPAAQTQGYNYQNSYQAENERKRQLNYDDQNGDYDYSRGKRQKNAPAKKPFQGVPRVPCRYWHEGKCKKGTDCNFIHD